MLSIKPSDPQKCTPNLLPARISHNGRINDTRRYWKSETDEKGIKHAHFRGRHLHGTPLSLPQNYTGAVLHMTDKQLPKESNPSASQQQDDAEEDGDAAEDEDVDVMIAEQVGEFDEMVIWGHGGQIDASQDTLMRGVQEWIGFAESMHVDDEPGSESTKST